MRPALVLLVLLVFPAFAEEPAAGDPSEPPAEVGDGKGGAESDEPKTDTPLAKPGGLETDPKLAEAARLRENMRKRAQRAAWKGVDDAYQQLVALEVELEADDHVLGADASRNLGDSWSAYQRCVVALRADESLEAMHDTMRTFREGYGRLTVRRIDATPIEMNAAQMPFTPDARASIEFAKSTLSESGAFDGLVPVGSYTVGPHTVEVSASLKPVVVQREAGDGDGDSKKK